MSSNAMETKTGMRLSGGFFKYKTMFRQPAHLQSLIMDFVD